MISSVMVEEAVAQLKVLETMGSIEKQPQLKIEFQQWQHRLKDPHFKLAVVGEAGVGKTSLLQALLGVTWTEFSKTEGPIVEIENILQSTHHIDLYRHDGTVLEEASLQVFPCTYEQWVASQRLTMKGRIWKTNTPITFLDGSGLSVLTTKQREEIHQKVLSAHGCIYLLPAQGFSTEDVAFLRYLRHYHKNFLFVQNHIDTWTRHEGVHLQEQLEEHLREQERILYTEIFPPNTKESQGLVTHFVGVSALQARVAVMSELSSEMEVLYKESQFDQLKQKILLMYQENKKEGLAQKHSIETAYQRLEQQLEGMKEQQNQEKKAWENSPLYGKYRQYGAMKEQLESQQPIALEKLEHYVKTQVHEVATMAELNVAQGLEQLQAKVEMQVVPMATVEELESFSHQQLSSLLMGQIQHTEKIAQELLAVGFQQIYNSSLLKIARYNQKAKQQESLPPFPVVGTPAPMETFPEEERDLKQLKQDILMTEKEEVDEHQAYRYLSLELNGEKQRLLEIVEEITQRKGSFQKAITKLGEKPLPEMKTYQEEINVKGGGDAILAEKVGDFFEGKKIAHVTVSYEDDSKAIQWEEDKKSLTQEHESHMTRLKEEKKSHETQGDYLEKTLWLLEEDQLQSKQSLEAMAKKWQRLTQELQEKEEKARLVYLNAYKSKLLHELGQYLQDEGGIQWKLLEDCRQSVESNGIFLLGRILQAQREKQQATLLEVQQRLEQENSHKTWENQTGEIAKLEDILSKLGEVLATI